VEQDTLVSDFLLIAKGIKKHLLEVPDCKHDLKSIVREALEDKTSGLTRPEQDTATITPEPTRNDQENIRERTR